MTLKLELPPPLAPREMRFEVDERIGPDGAVIQSLGCGLGAASRAAIRAAGAQAAGVCLLHSFRNPDS